MDAILSRANHVDLGVSSSRALALWVQHMVVDREMLAQDMAEFGVVGEQYEAAKKEIAGFIVEHRDAFRSLTLREASKIGRMYIASHVKGRGDRWQRRAAKLYGAA